MFIRVVTKVYPGYILFSSLIIQLFKTHFALMWSRRSDIFRVHLFKYQFDGYFSIFESILLDQSFDWVMRIRVRCD